MSRSGRDPASRLLVGAVRLLPASRREWGAAMRAELAGIESGRARRSFALGCARVAVTQPAVLRGIGYPLLMAGAEAAVIGWTTAVGYAPLRWGLVALVSILVAVSWLGRRPGVLGPAGDGRAARLVRAGGCLLVGAMALGVVMSMGSADNPAEKARNGVPILTVVLTCCLLGILAVTAQRSAASGRVLAAGVGGGVGAAAAWVAMVLADPPIPASIGAALALIAAAMAVAAFASGGRRGSAGHRLLAALSAGTVAALLIVVVLAVLASYGPPSLIPDIVPVALTPAADLAQSRIEIEDPYLAVLFLGCLLAAVLSMTAIATRQAGPDPARDQADVIVGG